MEVRDAIFGNRLLSTIFTDHFGGFPRSLDRRKQTFEKQIGVSEAHLKICAFLTKNMPDHEIYTAIRDAVVTT